MGIRKLVGAACALALAAALPLAPSVLSAPASQAAVVTKRPAPPVQTAQKKPKPSRGSAGLYAGPWDIVLVLTDDQPVGTLEQMSEVNRLLISRGVNYTNAVVPTSICCPSRASLFTGLLAPDTGVFNNKSNSGNGGYPVFWARGNEQRSIAVALDNAGYDTAFYGKFMNEFGQLFNGTSPPGWDTWTSFVTNDSGSYRNYAVGNGVRPGQTRTSPKRTFVKQYSTTYFGDLAVKHIKDSASGTGPMFTVFAPYAPHAPYFAPKRYRTASLPADYAADLARGVEGSSVQEADLTDKPRWIRDWAGVRQGTGGGPPLVEGAAPGGNLTQQQNTLMAVDEQVGRIVKAVEDAGRLDRTLFIYVSDNGYLHGEHWLEGKGTPHYRSTNVPLVVRWGNQSTPAVDPTLTIANVDLSATILTAAGLRNTSSGLPVTEPSRNNEGVQLIGVEAETRFVRPPFCGWRTATEMFTRYGSGEEEYYDYSRDPYELSNQAASTDPAVKARVGALRDKARKACDKPPPGYGPNFDKPRWKYPDGTVPDPSPSGVASGDGFHATVSGTD